MGETCYRDEFEETSPPLLPLKSTESLLYYLSLRSACVSNGGGQRVDRGEGAIEKRPSTVTLFCFVIHGGFGGASGAPARFKADSTSEIEARGTQRNGHAIAAPREEERHARVGTEYVRQAKGHCHHAAPQGESTDYYHIAT